MKRRYLIARCALQPRAWLNIPTSILVLLVLTLGKQLKVVRKDKKNETSFYLWSKKKSLKALLRLIYLEN